jgi:hypothetical protein
MSRRITLSPDTRAFVRDILTVMDHAGFSTELGCSTEETVDGMIGLLEQGYLALHTRAHSHGGTLIELIVLTPDGPPLGVATSLHIHDLPWIDRDNPMGSSQKCFKIVR